MTAQPRPGRNQIPEDHDPFAGPPIVASVPTTEPQREIWMATEVSEEASLAYNESVTLWMHGHVDLGALRASLGDVIERHEALRSTFSSEGLTLIVAAEAVPAFEIVDATAMSTPAREERWSALLAAEVSQTFDLLRGPLVRVKVFLVDAEEHRVTFTAHHIVCDGWSTAVLIRDWATLYSARVRQELAHLPPAESFAAYARAREQRTAKMAEADDEAYWVARFAEDVPILDLPLDRARPKLKTFASRREDFVLDAELIRELRRVGSADRASLFAILLAGFEALLARLTGQLDLVVGVPAAGQSVGGHQELVGHCVHVLPLRVRVDPESGFRALLATTRTSILDAYEHQGCTFGGLLKRLPVQRDPSRLPLVNVVFNVDRGLGPDAIQFQGIRTQLTTNPRLFENFELFVNAVELSGSVTLECQYNADLFDGATIRRWLEGYARLLRSVCESPDERVGRLHILTDQEVGLLRAWNSQTDRSLDPQARVHDRIAAQAARTPDATAVDAEGSRLTYAELDAKAEALARQLREAGVARGTLVGLCVERSADMVAGLLGILKSGGAYVPLDPNYPFERLAFMVRDSGMRVLVTQEKLRAELPLEAPSIVLMEKLAPRSEGAPLRDDAMPDDPAYVIYTSGSTGIPKGVLVPHRSVLNLVASMSYEPGMTASDVVVAVTTLSFDIAVVEIILPLAVGARIVLATRAAASDGEQLLALIHGSRATFMQATPATWRLLLASGWQGGEGLTAICGGEALPRDLAVELVKRCAKVWNAYGPTETTVWSTLWPVQDPVGRVLIGKPMANTHLYVLDARMQQVPLGVVGELFIGGAGVTLGYHERPELTRERFLPDPFRGGDARMYKTGDLVRLMPDGNVECLGRNDSQVKLRGFRIELGEVESAIGRHPDVSQVTAIVREDRPGDARLVAYVALRPEAELSDAYLREHVKRTLPDYMVPQHFVVLAALPLLPNGKVDRRNLPPPVETRSESDFVDPRTPTERQLAALWQDVLGIGRVSVHDDFFSLGGHSLLASQVIARLRRDHGLEVTFRKMFEAPTIEKLAAAIDMGAAPVARDTGGIPVRPAGAAAPLSIAQRRLWLLEEMDPAQRLVHNLTASWRLDGPVDVAVLERAIGEIVQRHEPLRTNFRVVDGEPVQLVHRERTIEVTRVDLSGLPEGDREDALSRERDGRASVPFDLQQDPLFRVVLFKVAGDKHVLWTVSHNIIWDGWSFDVFLAELTGLFEVSSGRDAVAKAPPPIAYADFAAWQRDWLGTAEFEEQAVFWRSQLRAAPFPLELPTDRPRKGTRSRAGGSEGIHVSAERAEALASLAQSRGVTLFMLLFSAYAVMLHRYTGQREILIGVPMRARSRPELESLIGLFVNTVALRTTVDPAMTFADVLTRVREVTLEAFGRQDVPLDALGVPAPMLRALFSLQDARERPARLGEARLKQEHVVAPVAASEMMLWAMQNRSDLLLMINYASDLFDGETILRFLRELDTLLEQVQADPLQRVGRIPILPAIERDAIARAGGRLLPPGQDDVFSVVTRTAASHPDAVALEIGGQSLSYARLVEKVDAVAGALVARGAGPAARVAIRIVQGVDRVASLLAVMATGAEVALDERDPATLVLEALPAPGAPRRAVASFAGSIAFSERGAAVKQSSLVRALAGAVEAIGLRPADVVAIDPRLGGAVGMFAALLPLFAGAKLSLSEAVDAQWAVALGANVVVLAPGLRRALPVGALRKVVVFGATSPTHRAKLLASASEVFELRFVHTHAIPVGVHRADANEGRRLLGKPLPGIVWRVVDSEGATAPMAVGGRLLVEADEGPVASGDRARLLADGSFEDLGRTDGLVLLDDGLVDTRQIARILESHTAVAEAWVSVREDAGGERRLVAYYAMKPGMACTETELRAAVRAPLGDRAVPRMLVELDALPRDAAGVVDDERLASPYVVSAVHEYVAPRTEAEKYLASVWKDTLGVARIGVYDNFFDLGGHSLLCFRLIGRMDREIGARISPRIVLLGTLEQVAIEVAAAAPALAPARGREPGDRDRDRDREAGTPATRAGRVVDWLKGFVKG